MNLKSGLTVPSSQSHRSAESTSRSVDASKQAYHADVVVMCICVLCTSFSPPEPAKKPQIEARRAKGRRQTPHLRRRGRLPEPCNPHHATLAWSYDHRQGLDQAPLAARLLQAHTSVLVEGDSAGVDDGGGEDAEGSVSKQPHSAAAVCDDLVPGDPRKNLRKSPKALEKLTPL